MKIFCARCFYLFITAIFCFSFAYLPNISRHFKKDKKVLNVLVWGDFLSPETIDLFEKETGIQICPQFYSTNEELLMKLKKPGESNVDIIFPSDYIVGKLVQDGYIQSIDHSQLNFISRIEPYLLNRNFDPNNQYSIPYSWEIYAIATNQQQITLPEESSLEFLFRPQGAKIVMTPDPLEAFLLASYYCFDKQENKELNAEQINSIKDLLKEQKAWIEAYADYGAKQLISTGNCPIALLKSSFVSQTAKENTNITFSLPKEGIFTSIENIAIGSYCKQKKEVYALINFLYRPEIMAKQIDTCPLYPSCLESISYCKKGLEEPYLELLEHAKLRKDMVFFYPITTTAQTKEVWIHAKT